ncbi:MAG: NAD(P)H-hydrate dehydratase, partial [Melioribacteraceae bacterium]|nr:NAD(P)H-hydrate dehydratase [Melioribacteraceae bacterium]
MKIFNADQIREIDTHTIQHDGISSVLLMERASKVFFNWLKPKLSAFDEISIFAGPGNNGGDALFVSRLLVLSGFNCKIFLCRIGKSLSSDCDINLERLKKLSEEIVIHDIQLNGDLPDVENHVVIDGIFGSGLNRSVTGYWATLFEKINEQAKAIYSIDIPSGVFSDIRTTGASICATETLSFEYPKFSFMFPENYKRVGNWESRSIGLNKHIQEKLPTQNFLIDYTLVKKQIQQRTKFQHKGHFGHLCLVGGSYGIIGAVSLAALAALRTGTGLLSIQIPSCGYSPIQSSIPEAMVFASNGDRSLQHIKVDEMFSAYALGCGMGQAQETVQAFLNFLSSVKRPLVLDADALNILGSHKEYLGKLPEGSILTPHMKEFSRIFGETRDDFQRHYLQKEMSRKFNLYILLKGAHSCITTPGGQAYFNSSGNPG